MKEFIEIPFGAKDSELCGWEYTIPEGYTASIENGKIVVKKEESEDEKIRMALIHYFSHPENTSFEYWEAIPKSEAIAWLEKQGEMKSKKEVDNLHNYLYGERKSVDKVEPKFKVGDFIVNDYCKGKVIELTDDSYLLDTGQGIPFSYEHNAHLWTIQDAKDGDVLFGSEWGVILMFRGIGNTEWDDVIDYHCYYDCHRECFIVQEDVEYWGNTKNNQLKPATKEQRDLLFQKMKEAGYEWDDEKKELNKIEPKPDIEMITPEESLGIDSETYNKIVDECIYGWQNHSWSEEDENKVTLFMQLTEGCDNEDELADWLKSLKDRVQPQWKPSEEQLTILLNAINGNYISGSDRQVLSELYRNLIKL